ncbi:MAG TPA: hypothetical protein G4O13_01015 [Dehalococcoidia bacterium]|nr:hypothetical protein [Dehalococcoidia bacterium]
MSKLLEKLELLSEGRAQPLGFGAAAARAKSPQMVVVASVPAGDIKLVTTTIKAGADAVLVTIEHESKKEEALSQLSRTKIEIPWGVSLDKVTREEARQLAEIGCDFVVFAPAETPAALLGEEKIGKVLRLDASLEDSLTRTINRLSVDAILLSRAGEEQSPLTVHQLMVYERLAASAGKYLLADMPPGLPTDDVESLWELGVRGLVVDLAVKDPEQRLSQVQEAIQKLPTTRKKKRGGIAATLPLAGAQSEITQPDEDDEEDI